MSCVDDDCGNIKVIYALQKHRLKFTRNISFLNSVDAATTSHTTSRYIHLSFQLRALSFFFLSVHCCAGSSAKWSMRTFNCRLMRFAYDFVQNIFLQCTVQSSNFTFAIFSCRISTHDRRNFHESAILSQARGRLDLLHSEKQRSTSCSLQAHFKTNALCDRVGARRQHTMANRRNTKPKERRKKSSYNKRAKERDGVLL